MSFCMVLPDLPPLGLKQINIGLVANDGQGDPTRTAFSKINENFALLSGSLNEKATAVKTFYVSPYGSDSTNSGLTAEDAFRTIQKAVSASYALNLAGYQAVINLMPGTYGESITISGLPDGAYTSETPIITIQRTPGQTDPVNWVLNPNTSKHTLSLINGARVRINTLSFSLSQVLDNSEIGYIKVLNSVLVVGSGNSFDIIGTASSNAGSHIILDNSILYATGGYSLKGGGRSHIHAKNNSYAISSVEVGDPKVVNATTTSNFVYLVEAYNRSDVIFDSARITFTGTIGGRAFFQDFTSTVELDTFPNTLLVGLYGDKTINNNLTLQGSVNAAAGLVVSGPLTVESAAQFESTTQFLQPATFIDNVALGGVTTAQTPLLADNSTKVATTEYVQQVVQNKLVTAIPIATDQVFGLVKTDVLDADPVVYTVESIDALLAAKANVQSPVLLGEPKAPTRNVNDSSTNIATTAFVQGVVTQALVLPAGIVLPWAGPESNIPAGFLICRGQYLLRSEYPALYAAIGIFFGATDSNNFRLPNFEGRFPMGVGGPAGASIGLGQMIGAAYANISVNNLPAHGHEVIDQGHSHSVSDAGHSHEVRDPGHRHEFNITDRVEDTGTRFATYQQYRINQDPNRSRTSSSSSTGITVRGATSNIGINASGVGIQIRQTGGGLPLAILPPSTGVHFIIKF